MANLVHIAEVGVLLFVAFSVSWVIGYGLHRLTARKPVVAAIPADRLAAVTAPSVPDEAALVRTPVVEPLHNIPPPRAVDLPADSIKAIDDLSKIPLAPTLPPLQVSEPVVIAVDPTTTVPTSPAAAAIALELPVEGTPPTTAPLDTAPTPTEAAPAPAPVPELQAPAEPLAPRPAEPVPPSAPAMPTSRPGVAYAGSLHGRPSRPLVRPAAQPGNLEVEPTAFPPISASVPDSAALIVASSASSGVEPSPAAEPMAQTVPAAPPAEPQPTVAPEPPVIAVAASVAEPEPAPVPVAAVEPVEPAAPPPPPPRPVYDEDAAMRAIEGGWSRRASRALPDAPELIDVSAAVAKAQSAVQQVLVQSGIDPEQVSDRAKPAGTTRPRDNSGDDLKRIDGITPLDEQTLNNLGIYRFEQISGWDPTEILWLENHAFARGRIVGEDWQGKARVLVAGRKTA